MKIENMHIKCRVFENNLKKKSIS